MRLVMRNNWIFLLALAVLAACSQTVSPPSSDDESSAESSSEKKDSKKKATSSSSESDELDEDCEGESGKVWDGTTAKSFACGSGTKLSPYVILTAEQLAYLSFVVGADEKKYQGKHFKLGADITLNKGKVIDSKGGLVADTTKLHKWTPIGNSNIVFDGTFDGDGHTISGMFINTTSTHNGLFGYSTGIVHDLTLENSWIQGGKFTGGIVGYSDGTVENLTNMASVSGDGECVGGVLGNSGQKNYRYNSVIKNAVNKGIVVGNKNVGGISGCATAVTVNGVENLAPIEGFGEVGGVFGGIGTSSNNDVKNLKNSGKVTGSHFIGGVMGSCGGIPSIYSNGTTSVYCVKNSQKCGQLQNAYNQGHVVGKSYVGGVLGMVCSGTISSFGNVSDVEGEYNTAGVVGSASYTTSSALYNRGNVYGSEYVGGIFSYNKEGVTSSAYSTGKVDGDSLVGLVIGYNYNATMADYYYLKQGKQEPFGLNDGGGAATPKTANDMKSEDFAELLGEEFVYDSDLNGEYPILKWEEE